MGYPGDEDLQAGSPGGSQRQSFPQAASRGTPAQAEDWGEWTGGAAGEEADLGC